MLRCVSVNHRNAPFNYLEQVSTLIDAAQDALLARPDVHGAIVLSTCNRFEIYLDSGVQDVVSAVAESAGLDVATLRTHSTVLAGDDVAHHLFSVASGLESVVIGEEEISGQVGRALSAARTRGAANSALERLFQSATKTSRGVKSSTALSVAGRSLVRLALELASSRVPDWSAVHVVLVGTGRYAATTLAALRERGVDTVSVFSPSGRAEAFALSHGVHAASELREALSRAHVAITCTAHEEFVVAAEDLEESLCSLVIDLGLPRNVDPEVGSLLNVELLDLETIRLHAPLEQLSSADDARMLVGQAAAAFAAERAAAPAVVALRGHLLGVLESELERRGGSQETEAALRHFVGVLLHAPSVRARDLALAGRADEFVSALDAVFDVQLADAAAVPDTDTIQCA